jgi:hypothetical protein
MALYAYLYSIDDGPVRLGEIEAPDHETAGQLANRRHADEARRLLIIKRVWLAPPRRDRGEGMTPPTVEPPARRINVARHLYERPYRRPERRAR